MTWGGQGRAFWVHFALGEGQMGTLSRPHFHPFHSRGGSRGGDGAPPQTSRQLSISRRGRVTSEVPRRVTDRASLFASPLHHSNRPFAPQLTSERPASAAADFSTKRIAAVATGS